MDVPVDNSAMTIELGRIIEYARQIEHLLVELGADGVGIHALAGSLQEKLPEHILKQLHYIAAVRNKAAHDKEFKQIEDFKQFEAVCTGTVCSLQELLEQQKSAVTTNPAEENVSWESRIELIIKVLPFIPGLNILYFIYIVVAGMWPGFYSMIMALLSGLGWFLICNPENYQKIMGIFILVTVYLFGLELKEDPANDKAKVAFLTLIPALNLIPFIYLAVKKNAWKIILAGLILAGLSGLTIWLLTKQYNKTALTLAIIVYLAGIITSLVRNNKRTDS
ncbi:MAG: hypothetical protein WC071_09235 [Victivallaceae bacterium]